MNSSAARDAFNDLVPASLALNSPNRLFRNGAYFVTCLAVWSVLGRYWGIQHDALAYMLQAVARLRPDPLATDIFLRFRSQEEFTVFPQISAYVISLLGIDRAGSLLTFSCLLTWIVVAWFLVQRLVGRSLAMLSVGLLLVIPGWYGAGRVFRYAEPFLTARPLAEALSLAALLAVFCSRRWLAALLVAVALLIHPLIAFPAALLVAALTLPVRNWMQWGAFVLLLVSGATAGSLLLMLPDPLMQGEWLSLTRWRCGFLFVGEWAARDREVAAQTLLTLALASAVVPQSGARKAIVGALVISASGLVLAALASELLPLKLLLQGQPWRWIWLGRFFATAMLPLIVLLLWRAGSIERAVAILLGCAWLLTDAGSFRDVEPIGVGGLLCALALILWSVRERVSPQVARSIIILSWCTLAIVVLSLLSTAFVAAQDSFSGFGSDPLWVQRVSDALHTPGIAVLVIALAWHSTVSVKSDVHSIVIMMTALVLIAGALPETVRSWTRTLFDDHQRTDFAEWRSLIPSDAEVLWTDAPHAAWFLLDRRSYLTISQAAGTVFSREANDEVLRRANALSALVAPGMWFLDPSAQQEDMRGLTPSILHQICQDSALGFVVSPFDLGHAVSRAEWPGRGDFIYLYDCRDHRVATAE